MAKKKKPKGDGEKKAKAKTVWEVREEIQSRYDKPVVIYEDTRPDRVFPTRFLRLNSLLGGGPKEGGIVEVFGPEDAGKSSLAVSLGADVQAQSPPDHNHVVLLNYERAQDYGWWKTLGLDTSTRNFTQLRPRSLEQGVAELYELVETGNLCAAIIDSVYAAGSKSRRKMIQAWGKEEVKEGVALAIEAKRWGEAWTSLIGPLMDHGVVVIAVNQVREDMDTRGPPKKKWQRPKMTTPRGKALKFYAWQRLELEKRWLVDSEGSLRKDVDGIRTRIRVIKNKNSDDSRGIVDYDLIRGLGWDLTGDLIDLAIQSGVIKAKGGGHYSLGKKKIRGMDALRDFVESSEKVQVILRRYVKSYLEKQAEDEEEETE